MIQVDHIPSTEIEKSQNFTRKEAREIKKRNFKNIQSGLALRNLKEQEKKIYCAKLTGE